MVVKGVSGLMRKAVESGEFEGVNFCGNFSFKILQFADDTLLIREGSWRNLWGIKSILRGFKIGI